MDEEEGRGPRLSKRFSDKEGEVDYKDKAGTAWSHSYLNQKPWHPLSYPNQRRKWIAEQTHAQHDRRAQEVAREYAQEQEFFRQTALVSKKEKEKMEMMKAVSFMYIRPPGYNPESAKAAEVADDERKIQDPDKPSQSAPVEEKKKPRPKDVFGHALPTEEQFEVLKNAPRLETGVAARAKPFGIEIRNVKCLRCGTYGHQSGDRECPLKDAIMPNEESRLRKDDPLTAMLAHVDTGEPLKWELKQKPGMSPPRGGFKPDDPNQQIVAEDIFDEYGGFLGGESIPELLTNFSSSKPKKSKRKQYKNKRRRISSSTDELTEDRYNHPEEEEEEGGSSSSCRPKKKIKKHKKKRQKQSETTSSSGDDDSGHYKGRSRHGRGHKHYDHYSSSSEDDDDGRRHTTSKHCHRHGHSRHRRNHSRRRRGEAN